MILKTISQFTVEELQQELILRNKSPLPNGGSHKRAIAALDLPIEWGPWQAVHRMTGGGICRTKIFNHIKNGDFKSIFVKKKGATNGTRLVELNSVREWLRSQTQLNIK